MSAGRTDSATSMYAYGPGIDQLIDDRGIFRPERHQSPTQANQLAPRTRRRSMDAGFDAHLVKPVVLDALQPLLADRPKPPTGRDYHR